MPDFERLSTFPGKMKIGAASQNLQGFAGRIAAKILSRIPDFLFPGGQPPSFPGDDTPPGSIQLSRIVFHKIGSFQPDF